MNKTDITKRMADELNMSGSDAGTALDCVLDAIGEALANGEDVRLAGFGTFAVKESPARTGRNPGTGETLAIAASKRPSFKAGKALRDAMNGR